MGPLEYLLVRARSALGRRPRQIPAFKVEDLKLGMGVDDPTISISIRCVDGVVAAALFGALVARVKSVGPAGLLGGFSLDFQPQKERS